MLDSFIIERLHRRAKDICRPIVNTQAFEKTCCTGMLERMVRADVEVKLSLHHRDENGISHCLRLGDRLCYSTGNFVEHDGFVGQITSCRLENGIGILAVRLCSPPSSTVLSKKSTSWCQFCSLHPTGVAEWNASACRLALGAKKYGDDFVVLS